MIEIPFSNGHSYQLKNSWKELTSKEYKAVLEYIVALMNGQITLSQLRLKVLFLLSELKPQLHHNREKADQQAENITRIAHQMNFMLRIEYENTKSFSKLKKEVRDQLTRYLPEELEQTPEVRWAHKAFKALKPDLVFAANLIPVIGRRRHTLNGYTFEVSDNILVTSLTTSQFIDAQTVALEIQETGKESLLNLLVAILYGEPKNSNLWPHDSLRDERPDRKYIYDAQRSSLMAKKLDWLDLETKKAIFINFNAIQSYLITRTKYSILFNAPDSTSSATEKPKHNLGLGSVAHSLIKSGYEDIENSNLVKFFEIMYNELVGNVTTLHRQGITIDKIAEQTGLTISKINQII